MCWVLGVVPLYNGHQLGCQAWLSFFFFQFVTGPMSRPHPEHQQHSNPGMTPRTSRHRKCSNVSPTYMSPLLSERHFPAHGSLPCGIVRWPLLSVCLH